MEDNRSAGTMHTVLFRRTSVPAVREPAIPLTIWVSVGRARVLGFLQCWGWKENRILLRLISECH